MSPGYEVIPMLNAMSQGNDGSMCTIHANSSEYAFLRLASYAMQSPERLPIEASALLVAGAIDFVVFIGQTRTPTPSGVDVRRYVSSVREVVGADGRMVVSNEVFGPGPDGRARPADPIRRLPDLVLHGYDPSLRDRPEGWWT
jgi:Flp pilus assembly CpaF family ATPase